MKLRVLSIALGLLAVVALAGNSMAHCEIPCGIYNDDLRITLLFEHTATMEKSMRQIITLEKADHTHSNQLTRWIMNKEDHADKLQYIVTQYFMTQRIKPDTAHYEKKLILLHKMLILAMKCKQTTDLDNIARLRETITEFRDIYSAH